MEYTDNRMSCDKGLYFMYCACLQMFHRCQRTVQQINNRSRLGNAQEQKLTLNIVSSLARSIQDLSLNFKRSQSSYLQSECKKCVCQYNLIKRALRDACLCMGDLQAPPAPHFVFLITL